MATRSSILAWKIPWTKEPGRLHFMGLQRVGHDWVTKHPHTHTHTHTHTSCGGKEGKPEIYEILQARILEWVAIPFCRRSSRPRDWTHISCTVARFFTVWVTMETQKRDRCLQISGFQSMALGPVALTPLGNFIELQYLVHTDTYWIGNSRMDLVICSLTVPPNKTNWEPVVQVTSSQ